MPFKSKAQARYMFAKHSKIAKRWASEMKRSRKTKHPIKPLPNKVKRKKR